MEALLSKRALILTAYIASLIVGGRNAFASPAADQKKPTGRIDAANRHSLLEAWKAQHKVNAESTPRTNVTGGTPIVGRASMTINDAKTIVYTKNFIGTENNCDADPGYAREWEKSTAYLSGDHIFSSSSCCDMWMATNNGMSGATEPAFN